MKKILIIVIALFFTVQFAEAQLYATQIESGDTLISNTENTTDAFMLYNGSTNQRRPIRPTFHINVTEIGSNTSHAWLNVDVEVEVGKSSEYQKIGETIQLYDYEGFNSASQNDLIFSVPSLESYAGRNCRLKLRYEFGGQLDSTAYDVWYCADETGNMYTPPFEKIKEYSHKDLFPSYSTIYQQINAGDSCQSRIIDLRKEIVPGRKQLPSRGYVSAVGWSRVEDDSITCYVRGCYFGYETVSYIDTLDLPVDTTACSFAEFSFTHPEGTGFIDAIRLIFRNESGADTTQFISKILLEYDP